MSQAEKIEQAVERALAKLKALRDEKRGTQNGDGKKEAGKG